MKTSCNSWKTILCLVCFAGLLLTGVPAWASDATVTMSVADANLRVVLTEVAQMGRANLVVDVDPKDTISVDFNCVPFETALNYIARTKGLSVDKRGSNTFLVTTPEKMGKGFAQVEVFPLKYARADHVKDIIVGGGKSDSKFYVENPGAAKSEDVGTLKVDDTKGSGSSENKEGIKGIVINTDTSTNSIVVFGTPTQIEKIRKLLLELDVPYKQILLEAQVMAISKDASKELGIDWTWADFGTAGAMSGALPVATVTGKNGLVYNAGVTAKLSSLIENGEGKLLARPNILTFNGNKGTIFVGDQLPVITPTVSSGVVTYATEYKNAGITLSYIPRINENSQISASVFVEVSTPRAVTLNVGGLKTDSYQITTRSAFTNVRVVEGDTLVIGGLISSSELKTLRKVPILGDLPILGQFFRNLVKDKNENEVVIFLKAKIVK